MLFENLDIIKPIQKALKDEGYTKPTPIQEKVNSTFIRRKRLTWMCSDRYWKNSSFCYSNITKFIMNKRLKGPRTIKALILAPTRELAIQIGESFTAYGNIWDLKTIVIFGGVSQNSQTRALKQE